MTNPTQITSLRIPTEVIGSAKTLTEADSGKTFILTTSGTDGAAITLPTAKLMGNGFNFRCIIGATFATTAWTVVATAAIMKGGVNELETDTGSDGPSTTGGTTMTIVATTEQVGDWYDFICDGTSLFINGQNALDGGVTFA